ncbi:MAG: hypothetical protein RIS48_2558 [Pseudomonadota bacterium]|jgi:hypothetical protein
MLYRCEKAALIRPSADTQSYGVNLSYTLTARQEPSIIHVRIGLNITLIDTIGQGL